MLFFTILGMILYPITCLLPMKFTSGPHNEFYVIGGKMVYPLYVVFGFVAIYMFIVLLKNMNLFKRAALSSCKNSDFMLLYIMYIYAKSILKGKDNYAE